MTFASLHTPWWRADRSVKELYDHSCGSWQPADNIAATSVLWTTADRKVKKRAFLSPV
jgi:hypothetical protein